MIDDIQKIISEEFVKRKVTPFSTRLNPEDMANWADKLSTKHALDKERFNLHVRELFWAIASIQLSLGYTFLSFREITFPAGAKAVALKDNEIPDMGHMADFHYWFHVCNTWESIYRLWERVVTVLEIRLTPKLKDNLYYDGYVNLLKKNMLLDEQQIIKLEKFHKPWGTISKKRNDISHGKNNPFLELSIEVSFSHIINETGKNLAKYSYQYPNRKQEVNMLIDYFNRSYSLLELVKELCNSQIKPNYGVVRSEPHTP